MGFRLVPKSMTLNGVFCIISLNWAAFVANYVKVVDTHQQIFSQEMSQSTQTKHDGRAVLFVAVGSC